MQRARIVTFRGVPAELHEAIKAVVKAGLARDLPGNKRELTAAGRALIMTQGACPWLC